MGAPIASPDNRQCGRRLTTLGALAEALPHLVGLEPAAVQLDVVPPLSRQVVLVEDGADGADVNAGSAVYAEVGVYVILVVLVAGVDAVHGADVHAGGVLDPLARLGDDVGHGPYRRRRSLLGPNSSIRSAKAPGQAGRTPRFCTATSPRTRAWQARRRRRARTCASPNSA